MFHFTEHIIFFSGVGEFIRTYGYIGIFLFFITLDQVTPIPEEVTLLSIGYLSSRGIFNPFISGIISLCAFVSVDIAYYYLALTGNKLVKKLSSGKHHFLKKYKDDMKDHMPKTLLILCFIPRMRMFAPLFAGMLRISFKRFVLFDSIGLAAFTLVYVSLGYLFHNSLHPLMANAGKMQDIIFAAAMLLIAGFIIYRIRKEKK